jgi:hypothetical protein
MRLTAEAGVGQNSSTLLWARVLQKAMGVQYRTSFRCLVWIEPEQPIVFILDFLYTGHKNIKLGL